jgi:hypothetical protein
MGIKLYIHVADHAPRELISSVRNLLLVIAEDANDETRLSWLPVEVIADRMGITPGSVDDLIKKLGRVGREPGDICGPYEIRVPLKHGKNGRPVYSWEGRSRTWKVPKFPERDGDGARYRADPKLWRKQREVGSSDPTSEVGSSDPTSEPVVGSSAPSGGVQRSREVGSSAPERWGPATPPLPSESPHQSPQDSPSARSASTLPAGHSDSSVDENEGKIIDGEPCECGCACESNVPRGEHDKGQRRCGRCLCTHKPDGSRISAARTARDDTASRSATEALDELSGKVIS